MNYKVAGLALGLLALVGVALVLPFALQLAESRNSGKQPPPKLARIYFPQVIAAANRYGGPVCELDIPYSYDFWFENTTQDPQKLGVRGGACKCAKKVEIALLPKEWKGKRAALDAAHAGVYFLEPPGLPLLTSLAVERDLARGPKELPAPWRLLSRKGPIDGPAADFEQPVEIPAESVGWVRVTWKGEKLGSARLLTEMWVEDESAGVGPSLEVEALFVPPFRVEPATVEIGVLDSERRSGQAEIRCWSHTRPVFELQVDPPNDGLMTCAKPAAMTLSECQEFAKELAQQMQTPALSGATINGYRVAVRVQIPDAARPLELGPFVRTIVFKPENAPGSYSVQVTGVLRGDLIVGAAERDKVALGQFSSAEGAKATLPLSSARQDLEVEIDKVPEFLKVELTPPIQGMAGKSWRLKVEVPPGSLSGPLGPDATIYLKTNDTPPRRIRIPVVGTAAQ